MLWYSCEKNDDNIIDPILTFPTLLNAYITPNTFDTVILNSVVGVTVVSQDPVRRVSARVLNPYNVLLVELELKDDGVFPDTVAGDGNYTASINYQLSCKLVGNYRVELNAINSSGLSGSTVNVGFLVTNTNNHQPGISNLIAPDSIQRPSGTGSDSVKIFFLQVTATDPDGICDVNRAFFNSFKPDGNPSSGNPFQMYDDGNILLHGDSTAFNGKFSLLISIINNPFRLPYIPPQLGNYTFKFNTQDIGVLVSDTTYKIINVYP